MKDLTSNELKKIDGGSVNMATVSGIAALVAFLIGIVDGAIRPLKCR